MADLTVLAIPGFLAGMGLEAARLHLSGRREGPGGPDDEPLAGYEARDTVTSLSMGAGNRVLVGLGQAVAAAAFQAVHRRAPRRFSMRRWWHWALLLVADDLCYYVLHRSHHRVRILWAAHVTHHSSERYNLSTALRQDWAPLLAMPFRLPLAAAGFPPEAVTTVHAVNLLYQFGVHTEAIRKFPAPIEAVFSTPSHHRVHHGTQPQYLDRNYGGIFIVWDRLFGTFTPEGERVRYGLTKNINTFNPLRVGWGEFVEAARDVVRARSWADRVRHLLAPPGWQPAPAQGLGPVSYEAEAGDRGL